MNQFHFALNGLSTIDPNDEEILDKCMKEIESANLSSKIEKYETAPTPITELNFSSLCTRILVLFFFLSLLDEPPMTVKQALRVKKLLEMHLNELQVLNLDCS